MLESYKKKYHKNNLQYILIDHLGNILESDNALFTIAFPNKIQNIHPFFEILNSLLLIKNEHFEFSCINLELKSAALITDISIHINSNNKHLIIIENLTKHYNNYQLAAQTRNEFIINSQILELKNKYLLEKETFKNNFIANFSHQLRNPITASIIFSDLLINSNLSSDQKNYLDIIQSANKDLKNRIEDILDISKIESGKLILTEKVFSLKKLLVEMAVFYKVIAEKKGLVFNFETDKKLPDFLKGDQYRLKQIISNLLNNAIYYTNKGSVSLNVSLNYMRARKANLCIEVLDTGVGIAAKDMDSVFERFTKIESATQNDEHTGLGLAVVKHLISKMKGNVKVESEINIGSKFICNLSFKLSDYSQNLKADLLQNQLPKQDKKHHILLLEDSELIQLTILKILAATGSFYLTIISKGEELITNIIDQDVDVVLMANTISGFTAMDLAVSVRNLPKAYKKTPIIVLSTEAFKEDIKRFKQHGVNEVLVKPFDEKNLLDKIYKHIK
ncbi:ATP-binding response regulator [Gelatiniphilus marinus]|uniref:histidine kinase n=1 Tax=Gelatiniphilus marinus TaxID=1759464 RepID=A0ABW5JPH0_9FLAO